jgi:hypothetical protein
MKVLISPVSLEEAKIVVQGGCDILDLKNTTEGSLGAQPPYQLKEIVDHFRDTDMICSATLGDLPQKPGTAGLAAYGCAMTGANYVKAGLYGSTNYEEALSMMNSIVKSVRMAGDDILVVGSGYADFRRFGGVSYQDVIRACAEAKADLVMLDTAIKDGQTLTDAMTMEEIKEFVDLGHAAGLKVALAGGVTAKDIPALAELGAEIVGVRGAVCNANDRNSGITLEATTAFMDYVRTIVSSAEPY